MIRSIALSLFIIAFALLVSVPKAEAAPKPLEGWAWSDTIGWVSFSSENDHNFSQSGTQPSPHTYGVHIEETTGEFSGYAWNGVFDPSSGTTSGVGWISFNAGDTAVCGQAAQLVGVPNPTGEIVGYARALAGGTSQSQTGGWTGCLELSGSNHISPEPNGGGGVTFSQTTNTIFGYAWGAIPSTTGNGGNNLNTGCSNPPGSDCNGTFQDGIIGWLEFRDVFVDLEFTEPTLTLQADPYVVYPVSSSPLQWDTTTLSWDSNIPLTDCQAIQTGSGNQAGTDWLSGTTKPDPGPPQGNQQGVEVPHDPTNYQIACEDQSGSTVESNVEVVVQMFNEPSVSLVPSDQCIPEAGNITFTWDSSNVDTATCRFYESTDNQDVVAGNLSTRLPSGSGSGSQSVSIQENTWFLFGCDDFDPNTGIVGFERNIEVGGSCALGDDDDDGGGGDGIIPRYEEI